MEVVKETGADPVVAARVMQSETVRLRHLTATTVRVPSEGGHLAILYLITLAPLRRKSAEGSVGCGYCIGQE